MEKKEKTLLELARELFARCNRGLDRRSPEFRKLYDELCAREKEENLAKEALRGETGSETPVQ